jgi:arginyl-tRNA synthetase
MKETILSILKSLVPADMPVVVSVPEQESFGHYSTNVAMRLANVEKKAPMAVAEALAVKIAAAAPAGFFEKVEAVAPGFVNFWLSAKTIQEAFSKIAKEREYGTSDIGKKKTVIVEYSDVNIAKIMNLGHFRTTIIGAALGNILEFSGYKVIRWNYLGDWGTQFGKLIAAYKMWGKKADIERDPINELQKLYVRFHEEAKSDSVIEKRGQEEFKKLEDGDKENRKLWEWFKKESLKEFERAYRVLGVNFDVWVGEAFFEPVLKKVTQECVQKGIAERSEGAMVIKLDAFHLPPALIEKSDGASLYLTRDIANLGYRLKKYKPAKIFYVVGNEQALHFEQLFSIAKLLDMQSADLVHVKHGLVLGEGGKKFSTREGRTVSLSDALEKAVSLSRGIVEQKNPDLSEKEKNDVATAVGIGALKYNDLKENRMTNIVFDWERMLDFTGDSGPYLQYTYARLKSILRKAGKSRTCDFSTLDNASELALMRVMFEFPDIVAKAGEMYSTSTLATYLYGFAAVANKFYETTPIIKDENESRRAARLALIETAARVLKTGLGLLGIEAPEKI